MNKVIEAARNAKLIGASLEAKAILCAADSAVAEKLRAMADGAHPVDQLRYMFITSQASGPLFQLLFSDWLFQF